MINNFKQFNEARVSSQSALAAKEIKAILKKKYPDTKFSVKSENYSMGSSVRVNWIDGPNYHDVNKLVGEYQHGTFDGMTDTYNYRETGKENTAKYTFANREISKGIKETLFDIIRDHYSDSIDDYEVERKVREILLSKDIPSGATIVVDYDFRSEELKFDVSPKTKSYKETPTKNKKTEMEEKDAPKAGLNLEIVDYSERSFAVFGDTKEIKEQLRELGGRYNGFLKYGDGKKPGWIFSNNKREEVEKFIDGLK